MGNGMREGSFCPSLPLSVRTLFSPPLAFPHSAAPASASPPLHGLPTPPLSRGEGEVGAGVGSGGGETGAEKCEIQRATVHFKRCWVKIR